MSDFWNGVDVMTLAEEPLQFSILEQRTPGLGSILAASMTYIHIPKARRSILIVAMKPWRDRTVTL